MSEKSKPGPLPTVCATVETMVQRHISKVRKLRDVQQLEAGVDLLTDILEATENLQAAQLELKAVINIPREHADKGRDRR